jgi:hypothetical protein
MGDPKQILEKGSIEVRVKVSGMYKRHLLKVVREKTAFGIVPYLVGELYIPAPELMRLAQELQFPIKCQGMVVFPKGKAAADFAQKEPEKPKSLAHGRILGESEDDEGSDESEEDESEEETEEEPEEEGEEEQVDEPEEESNKENDKEQDANHDSEIKEEIEGNIDEQDADPDSQEEKQEEIEIEGSMDEKREETENKENTPKKKFFGGVLSEGLLS